MSAQDSETLTDAARVESAWRLVEEWCNADQHADTPALIRGLCELLDPDRRHRTPSVPGEDMPNRDARQKAVAEWCAAAFGAGQASSIEQRGLRLLEESIEAYQAAGCSIDQAHKLVDYVFSRPVGDLTQELGGVGITTLALANACGASADAQEQREFARVLAKPLSHFAARNQVKNDAGFAAIRAIGKEG